MPNRLIVHARLSALKALSTALQLHVAPSHETMGPSSPTCESGNRKGKTTMPTAESQVWKSGRLTIERSESETREVLFRLSGPFTARDIYSSLSPDAIRSIFEPAPGGEQPAAHTLDLAEVPYMDSIGLGMLASHYVRCQSRAIRLTVTGLSPRVQELLRLTKMDTVLPIAAN